MSNVPVKGSDSATYQLALPSLGSTPASGALSVIPSPDGTHAKTADITALSTALTGAIAATQTVSVTGTAAVTQSGAWTVGLSPSTVVSLAGGNTVALKTDGSAVTQPISGTVGATQTGAWSVTLGAGTATIGAVNILGGNTAAVKTDGSATTQPVSVNTLPLPAGAATAAKQPAIGVAGTASADVLTVQGAAAMTALKVDGSGATQPVSATALPLPTGAATNTSVQAITTALGSPFQAGASIANTAFGISGTLPAFAATPTFNLGTLGGAATAAAQGTGNTSLASIDGKIPSVGQKTAAGSVPVVLSSDGPIATAYGALADTATPDIAASGASFTFSSLFKGMVVNLLAIAGYEKPYSSNTTITPGSPVPAGRAVFIASTATGSVRLKLSGGSTIDVPVVATGPTLIDKISVVDVVAANTTGTHVVSVLS